MVSIHKNPHELIEFVANVVQEFLVASKESMILARQSTMMVLNRDIFEEQLATQKHIVPNQTPEILELLTTYNLAIVLDQTVVIQWPVINLADKLTALLEHPSGQTDLGAAATLLRPHITPAIYDHFFPGESA